MVAKKRFFYPALAKTIHDYAASVLAPIQRGESISTVWVSMAGRRMWNRFLIENISLFKKELPEFENYLLVYIEPLDLTEESSKGYLRLMGESLFGACQKQKDCQKLTKIKSKGEIFEDESVSYPKLLAALREILKEVTENGFQVVFFLGEFDELSFANKIFYNNLKSLWDRLKPKLHYIFLSIQDLAASEMTDQLGELNELTLQNVVYIPIRQGGDVDYLIDFFEDRLGTQFNQKERKLIKDLCGGHPYLVKAATRITLNLKQDKINPQDLKEKLINHYELLSVTRRIFSLRSDSEKEVLVKIAFGKAISSSRDLKRLIKLGLVEEKDGQSQLFGELFSLVAQESQKPIVAEGTVQNGGLYIDKELGAVCYHGVSVEEKFSAQEYNLIKYFLEAPGKLKNRDDLSGVLWGEESYEKYSDWAIDQVMSKLRKKLKQLGTKSKVVTLRGRGYKFILE